MTAMAAGRGMYGQVASSPYPSHADCERLAIAVCSPPSAAEVRLLEELVLALVSYLERTDPELPSRQRDALGRMRRQRRQPDRLAIDGHEYRRRRRARVRRGR